MSISFEVFAKETTYNCERNKDSKYFEYSISDISKKNIYVLMTQSN